MAGENESLTRELALNTQPIRPNAVAEPVCIGAPVVSGIGEEEILERVVLNLGVLATAALAAGILPAGTTGSFTEVVVLSKRVTIQECEVFTNKVLVNGTLHKDLLFKFTPTTAPFTTGLITTGDCTALLNFTIDVTLDCPFGACIMIPGACPGDTCVIENACVDAEKELLIDINGDNIPEFFEEKVCILIRAKTVRQTLITITPTLPNICPTFPSSTPCPTPVCPPQIGLPSSVFVSRPTGFIFG
jgi:hypothetical protein